VQQIMDRSAWSAPVSDHEAHRRAGGRAHYNTIRKYRALMRQIEVLRLFDVYSGFIYRVQARIARELGVSRSTVSRDVKKIFHQEDPRQKALRELAEAMAYADCGHRTKWKDYLAQAIADCEVAHARDMARWRAMKGAPEGA
jgi:putative protein kinase ArgK-like GTPase of G3E family